MKTAGIICEYNPFHNGHKYQLELVREQCDGVVCIMSGSFVQRGDVAIFDKWTRTKAALSSGCDLVIELPAPYALSSAQGFARGAIDILSATGVIDTLYFGSECGDISKLTDTAKLLLNETEEISEKIKSYLSDGMSYPSAREKAYKGIIPDGILSTPNNILAIEYILELLKRNSSIIPQTHKRSDLGYHSMEADGTFASASKIREMILSGSDIQDYVPFDYSSAETYNLDKLSDIFRYILILKGKDAFSKIPDMEPGLDNRFLANVHLGKISDIIDKVKTKRYTKTRLQRIVCCVLCNITQDIKKPEYIRVLGMTENGQKILAKMKKTATYPIVNKVADFKDDSIKPDILSTDIAVFTATDKLQMGRDFTTSPIIV